MPKFLATLLVTTLLGLALGILLGAPEQRAPAPRLQAAEPAVAAVSALGPPPPERRPAETIVAELDLQQFPGGFLDDEGVKRLEEVCRQKCALGLELFVSWPGHARVPRALEERWALLENTFHDHATVLRETEAVLADATAERLAPLARRARAWSSVHADDVPVDVSLQRVDAARPGGADDDWTVLMLLRLAQFRSVDPDTQAALCRRVLEAPRLAREASRDASAWLRLLEKIGQPLVLGFDDGVTGEPASLARWLGSPILLQVRHAFAWKPPTEDELRAIEARHADLGLVVVELVIAARDLPPERIDRRLVVPEDPVETSWSRSFGIRGTPLFIGVDAAGRMSAVSQALGPVEDALAASSASAHTAPPRSDP